MLLPAGVPSPHQPPLPPENGTGRTWAEKFAERRQQWCFQPVRNPEPPPVKDSAWLRHPMDRFVLARLEAARLRPASPASPAVLARRLSFALTGLPPSTNATELPFEALVDRLLASPHFGEHWARHWMDVVRYAETFGSEHDYLNPHAWRYRDYLMRAFNEDLPCDTFIREQVAGDLLDTPRINHALGVNESLLATAFQRMTEFYATPVDVKREEAGVIDWQIENVSKAFLGLTVACARCHDHKFDPISTADYYGLFGVFTGARPVLNIVDDPQVLIRHDAELRRLKEAIRDEIAAMWSRTEIHSVALQQAVAEAKDGSPLAQLHRPPSAVAGTPTAGQAFLPLEQWQVSGPGLPDKPVPAGTFSLHADGEALVRAIHPAGWFSDVNSERHGGSVRSPEFVLTKRNVSVLACGTGKARLRLVVEGCQGDIVLFGPANKDLTEPVPRWITMRLRDQWLGRRAHVEVMTRDDLPTVGNVKDVAKWSRSDGRSSFGIVDVALHDEPAALASRTLPDELLRVAGEPADAFAKQCADLMRSTVHAWQTGALSDSGAVLLQALLDAKLLPNAVVTPGSRLARLISEYRALERLIPEAKRAPGVCDDGSACDVSVSIRGDYSMPGPVVPRRMPEVLGGRPLAHPRGDRYALALQLTRRDNPLTARVMVNRIWQHLFGRGLVATPDNFGRMGVKPVHPELLDHLATKFMDEGWSVKRLVRYIVTSSTWQTSTDPSPESVKQDADNALLSHALVRRLPAESIRDAMLTVAGNLDPAMGGPSVSNFYRTAVDPDKQPPVGPLDGGGRRSLYLEVRRNFLNDFLTAFDFPRPNNPAGLRSETNVPAQSITLLNDPFVLHQAEIWARRMETLPVTDEIRIAQMHREAFGREATAAEVARALAFLHEDGRSLRELAHAMFNMKEFIYLR